MSRLPRVLLLVAAGLVPAAAARAEDPPAGPYAGPQASVWNAVHRALFHRTGSDGKLHGAHELDPILFPSSTWPLREPRAGAIESALAALLAARDTAGGADCVARAILQRDLWAWHDWLDSRARFDWTTPEDRALCERLRARCAAAMRHVALAPAELDAVALRLAAANAQPDDDLALLLDEEAAGAWVRLASDGEDGPIAPAHSFHSGARSAFSVHVSTPGGREAALVYLARLGAAELTVAVEGELRLDPRLPQPPPGTRVALVRRAIHVGRDGELHVLALVESVQIRTFPRTQPPEDLGTQVDRIDGRFWHAFQAVRELDLDRYALLAGSGGLRKVGADEADLSSFASHGADPLEDARHAPRPRLSTCVGCHGAAGLHSVISLTRLSSGPGTHLDARLLQPPRKLVADTAGGWRTRALERARAEPRIAALLKTWRATDEGAAAQDG